MDFIKDDTSQSRSPHFRNFRRQKQDLQHLWNGNEDLTTIRVIDSIIASMNCPNRFSRRSIVLAESCVDFCSDLIDESLCWRNVNEDSVIVGPENSLHSIVGL